MDRQQLLCHKWTACTCIVSWYMCPHWHGWSSSPHRWRLCPGTILFLMTGHFRSQWHSLPCSTLLLLSPSSPSFFPSYCQRVLLLLTYFFLWFKVINWEVRRRKIGEIRVVGWLVRSSSSLCALSLTGGGGKLVLAIFIWNGKTNQRVTNRASLRIHVANLFICSVTYQNAHPYTYTYYTRLKKH